MGGLLPRVSVRCRTGPILAGPGIPASSSPARLRPAPIVEPHAFHGIFAILSPGPGEDFVGPQYMWIGPVSGRSPSVVVRTDVRAGDHERRAAPHHRRGYARRDRSTRR